MCIVKPAPYYGSYLLTEIEADLTVMHECQLKATSISMSAFARRYRDDTDRLIKSLKQYIKFYTLWKSLQKLWAYMTPIFNGSELGAQMVKQYEAFKELDWKYRASVEILDGCKRITCAAF